MVDLMIRTCLGDDYIEGGSHLDHLYGDAGNDTLMGGRSHDRLWGGDVMIDWMVANALINSMARRVHTLIGGDEQDALMAVLARIFAGREPK